MESLSQSADGIDESMCSKFALDKLDSEPSVVIVVMGQTGVGKTTLINIASGSNLPIGKGIDSCTRAVQESGKFELDGRLVTLVDTPGFDDSAISDVDVLEMIATYLSASYKKNVTLAGMIYMYRISDIRMSGSSRRNFKIFRKLCGENALTNVVIVTTMWGNLVDMKEGEARERELQKKDGFFKDALEKGAKMVRHELYQDVDSAHEILRLIIANSPLPLQIQQELVDQKKPLIKTLAGEEINGELVTKQEKYEDKARKIRQDLQEACDKDEETKRELERELEEHEEVVRKVKAERMKLKGSKIGWALLSVSGLALAWAAGILLESFGRIVHKNITWAP